MKTLFYGEISFKLSLKFGTKKILLNKGLRAKFDTFRILPTFLASELGCRLQKLGSPTQNHKKNIQETTQKPRHSPYL
jgi:hypothetical protein